MSTTTKPFTVSYEPTECPEEPWIIRDEDNDVFESYADPHEAKDRAERLNREWTINSLREILVEKLNECEGCDDELILANLMTCLEILS